MPCTRVPNNCHAAVVLLVRSMTAKVFHALYTGFAIPGAGCGGCVHRGRYGREDTAMEPGSGADFWVHCAEGTRPFARADHSGAPAVSALGRISPRHAD